jgi:hypothetical protein
MAAAGLTSNQGASPREIIIEACRRNNTSLLEETLKDLESAASKAGKKPTEYIAETLNKTYDGVGNGCLHVAATNGSCTSLLYSTCWLSTTKYYGRQHPGEHAH